MAERRGKKYPVMGVRTWRTLTVGFGMVNVKVSIQTLIGDEDRMSGHRYCKAHSMRVTQKYECPECGPCEHEIGYEHEGRIITLTDSEAACLVPLDYEKRLDLHAYVPAGLIDPLYIENTYGVWWAEDAYANAWGIFTEALRESGKWLIGVTQLGRTTRVMALRYSMAEGCVVAHTLKHDARIRHSNAAGIAKAVNDLEIDPVQVDRAEQAMSLVLAEDFDLSEIEDTYDLTLRAAIEAKAEGMEPPAAAPVVGVDVPDLMAALSATLKGAGTPKEKAAKFKARLAA